MKTIQTTISKSKYVLLALLVVFSFSCSTEDGEQGPIGPAGVDGTNGENGNANVQNFMFNSPSWNTIGSGLYIDLTGIITDDILENDVLLTFVKFSVIDLVSSIPGSVYVNGYRNYPVLFGNSTSTEPGPYVMAVISMEMDGSFTPNANLEPVDWVKLIIIESSNTTTSNGNGRVMSGKETVLQELKDAGVNKDNYEEVCDYYGIAY
ncbi:hypothetical protein [Bizionia arctica]|uniref:Collagen-like protein n=1 Tax=Bizionia arctica TaxID=1495645 RepID=A0A917LM27_9FLAO|nr:hypothetical protein [Bizionia arctica]GGG42442.1 hypothetical protein GCM10010976_12480 [Bizionia arctica]